jgi:hypothetical protein
MNEAPCAVSHRGQTLRSSTEQDSGLRLEEYASLLDSRGSQVAVHEGAIHLNSGLQLPPHDTGYPLPSLS